MLSPLTDQSQPGIVEDIPEEEARRIEIRLQELVHELRQPLTTIATCAYYLHVVLPEEAGKLHEQLDTIEQQVLEADRILARTSRDLKQSQAGPSGTARSDNRAFTNAEMAGVTY
jgi:hypothetical protein